MEEPKDLLLDANNDLLIVGGDLVIGGSLMQEVGLILQANQGDFRNTPLLGPGLVKMVKSKADPLAVQTSVMVHLELDGKDYQELRENIRMNIKTT